MSLNPKSVQNSAARRENPTPAQVAAAKTAAEQFMKAYRRGAKIRAWTDEHRGYGKDVAARAARKFKLSNVDDARKLPLLADPERGFTEEETETLTKKAIEVGFQIRVTPMKRLLAVRDHDARLRLAERMIEEGWSQARTEAEVREHNGGPGYQAEAGKPPRVPASGPQLLDEFARLAIRWGRLQEASRGSEAWKAISIGDRRVIMAVTRAAAGLRS